MNVSRFSRPKKCPKSPKSIYALARACTSFYPYARFPAIRTGPSEARDDGNVTREPFQMSPELEF